MKPESRPLIALIVFGPLLVVGAWLLARAPFLQSDAVGELPVVTHTATPPVAPTPPQTAPPTPDSVPRLLEAPTLSKTQIAFAHAGELWTVPREGGDAQRLVTGQLENYKPIFSPDGSMIAFTGVLDSNADVYVVPAGGGETRRLTYHPGSDSAVGWTPDGTRIVFYSYRDTARDLPKLFTVSVNGGFPEELPLPSGVQASYSADGKRVAYVPFPQWQPQWKKYRGGQTMPVWIADLADSHVTKVPRDNSNDRYPMWVGDTVYFVSDRNGPRTLFAYDVNGGAVREVVHNPDGFDIKSASAGPGGIVYDQFDQLRIYDIASGQSHAVRVRISAELPQVRPHFEKVEHDELLQAAVSPTGKRVLFEAHGEILSVPAEKGDVRNLTRSPGVADRDPAWSPDGKWIAWLSDESGEYALHFRAPDGLGSERKVDLGTPGSYFYSPRWSPDSKKILLADKRMNLWLIELDHPTPVKIDSDPFESWWFDPAWSPDSRFVAYVKAMPNHFMGIFVYALDDKSIHQITDGRSFSFSPRFDRSGKYLTFISSTDVGLGANGGGMTSMGQRMTSSIYSAVLSKTLPSPTAPESDEEAADGGASDGDKGGGKGGDKDEHDAKKPANAVKIDFDGIDQRIVALPIDRANYVDIEAGSEGTLFLLSQQLVFADEDYLEYDGDKSPPLQLSRFDLKKRKVEKVQDRIDQEPSSLATFAVTADGSKILYEKDKKWFIVPANEPVKPDAEPLKLDSFEVWVDPRAEWKQIFHEVWRIERDFLYDPNAHGLDLAAAEKLYAPFVDGIDGRDDLNNLLEEGLGNLVLGHVWADGGSYPKQDHVSVGQLGADYRIEEGRYRFAKILRGENWNPQLRAPLTQPGVDVNVGDFLLAVNGQELRATDDVNRLFMGRAGKQTVITVSKDAAGGMSRQVTVVPVGSEGGLRLRTWMDENRRKVAEMSGGRVGYVYIPDTAAGGFTNFNRYYFSEVGKDAVVLDERFNHGGYIADYIVNLLQWKPLMGAATREGEDTIVPTSAIFGPKVMIANQMSGSGGDALPWLFKKAGIGTLVGVRTWGGLVGIGGYPRLIDGGSVTAPRWALYGTTGEWEVENHGIAPDVEVEQDPALTRQGHDPQLERAVQIALDGLAKNPPQKLKRPPYPNYGPRLPHPHADNGN
jgi:tricorn protease